MSSAARLIQSLEDTFFAQEDQLLIERLRYLRTLEETRENLSRLSGITDPRVLDRLVVLGVRPQTVCSLAVYPLIAVAWADGSVSPAERTAILERIGQAPFTGLDPVVVGRWLDRKPDSRLLEAWSHYVKSLTEDLDPTTRTALKDELLGHAKVVAEASGGLLGWRSVSPQEQAVLDRLAEAWA